MAMRKTVMRKNPERQARKRALPESDDDDEQGVNFDAASLTSRARERNAAGALLDIGARQASLAAFCGRDAAVPSSAVWGETPCLLT
jgi:hypothetical protein